MTFLKIIAFLKVSGDFLHFSENPHFCAQKGAHLVILGWKSHFLGFFHFSPFWTIWSILQHLKFFQNKFLMLHSMSWHMFLLYVFCYILMSWHMLRHWTVYTWLVRINYFHYLSIKMYLALFIVCKFLSNPIYFYIHLATSATQ